jgi:hypothetical protein
MWIQLHSCLVNILLQFSSRENVYTSCYPQHSISVNIETWLQAGLQADCSSIRFPCSSSSGCLCGAAESRVYWWGCGWEYRIVFHRKMRLEHLHLVLRLTMRRALFPHVYGRSELRGATPNCNNIFIAKGIFNKVRKHYILMLIFPSSRR